MTEPTRDGTVGKMVARYEPEFALVLPPSLSPAMFVRLAQGKLRTDDKLRSAAERNPMSLFSSLMECARLGHEPGTNEFALVPFRNKDAPGGVEVVGMEQYQGTIERMLNTGVVMSVKAELVYELDLFDPHDEEPFRPPTHQPAFYLDPEGSKRNAWFIPASARGAMIGVYAYAVMEGGAISRVVKMPQEEVMKHKAVARTKTFWEGPWEPDMWIKTAVHKLETWVPTSAEQARRRVERLNAGAQPATVTPPRQTPGDPTQTGGRDDSGPHSQPDAVDAEVVHDSQEPPPNPDE